MGKQQNTLCFSVVGEKENTEITEEFPFRSRALCVVTPMNAKSVGFRSLLQAIGYITALISCDTANQACICMNMLSSHYFGRALL